jgi:hypothetical protein
VCGRFAVLTAKLVGDRFTLSVYETHIRLSGLTLLESDNLDEADQLTPVRTHTAHTGPSLSHSPLHVH